MVDPARNNAGLTRPQRRRERRPQRRHEEPAGHAALPPHRRAEGLRRALRRAHGEEPARRPPPWRGAARARSSSTSSSPSSGNGATTRSQEPGDRRRSSRIVRRIAPLAARRPLSRPDPCAALGTEAISPTKIRRTSSRPDVRRPRSISSTRSASDEPARTELERLLVVSSSTAPRPTPRRATLGALVDLLQVFEDDANMTALLRAIAEAAAPEVARRGRQGRARAARSSRRSRCSSRVLGEVPRRPTGHAICAKEIDPNRTLAVVLRAARDPAGRRQPAADRGPHRRHRRREPRRTRRRRPKLDARRLREHRATRSPSSA